MVITALNKDDPYEMYEINIKGGANTLKLKEQFSMDHPRIVESLRIMDQRLVLINPTHHVSKSNQKLIDTLGGCIIIFVGLRAACVAHDRYRSHR